MRPELIAALALAIAWAPAPAAADDVVVLVASGREARAFDLEQVRTAIAAQLGAEVQLAQVPDPTRMSVRLRAPSARRVVLELTRADGSAMRRSAPLPEEAPERVATIAILAVNLLRDESAELLALLRPQPPDVVVIVPEASTVTVAVVENDTAEPEDPQPVLAASVEPSPPVVIIEEQAEPVPAETVVPAPDEPPAPTPSEPGLPFLRIGLDVQAGSIPRAGGHEIDLFGGLELAWTPEPFLAIGLRDLSGGTSIDGDHQHGGGAPFVELSLVLHRVFALHGQLGADLRVITNGNGLGFGVAPLLVVGMRFQIAPEFSLGVESAARVVATDTSVSMLNALPALAISWTGGVSLLFHIR